MNVDRLETPIGDLFVIASGRDLRAVVFAKENPRQQHWLARELVPKANPGGITKKLARYFAGEVHALGEIAVRTEGTAFQEKVWRALRDIPAGETWTYAELAAYIGRPDAVRAVGHANGQNPLNIVVPCHRLIGSNGKLVAYGGGLARKEWLIAHEAKGIAAAQPRGARPRRGA